MTIRDPFKQKTDWAKKAQERLDNKPGETTSDTRKTSVPVKDEVLERVAKSFKIYPGNIARTFDKRVNKLQVHFDDLDYEKNYVDSGKYIMFLMSFAEKYNLHELYSSVDKNGEFDLDKEKVKEFLEKKLN